MLLQIAIFNISLICIIVMLFIKHREIKTGNPSILSKLVNETDHVVNGLYSKCKAAASHVNKHTFIGLLQLAAFHILSAARSAYIGLYKLAHRSHHAKMVIDMVRGRGDIFSTDDNSARNIKPGAASFFLKRISEEKIVENHGRL